MGDPPTPAASPNVKRFARPRPRRSSRLVTELYAQGGDWNLDAAQQERIRRSRPGG
ncbi:hypothetical protein [Saccharopolyspora sp. NPDC003762]